MFSKQKESANQSTANTPRSGSNIKPFTGRITKKRIKKLEDKVTEIESELIVTENVNKLLTQEVDDLHQYQRKACVILDA